MMQLQKARTHEDETISDEDVRKEDELKCAVEV